MTRSSRFKNVFLASLLFFVVGGFLFFTSVEPVLAQAGDPFGVQDVEQAGIALGGEDIRIVIARIIRIVLGLLGIITVSIILYGGFVYMTSGGAEDKIAQARKILINATIGLAIIMMSFSIVQFFISRFGEVTGALDGRGVGAGQGVVFNNFFGSGALGSGSIQDHYPDRDQINVKRNTSIIVTFKDPIDPTSLIENTNGTCWGDDGQPTVVCDTDGDGENDLPAYYGDCVRPENEEFNRAVHCDHVLPGAVKIFVEENDNALIQASAVTVYEDGAERNPYTFVFKPFASLGDDRTPMTYTVELTNDILRTNGTGIFDGTRSGMYTWNFTTGLEVDTAPPFVTSVYPGLNWAQNAPKNSVIQVHFSEPIDPTAIAAERHHTAFNIQGIEGQWRATNRYQTIEFISSLACGQNSCGDVTYCLPTPSCEEGDTDCIEDYQVLLRTAELLDPESGSFEAIIGTGIMDVAGNALNGRPEGAGPLAHDNNQADGKPPVGLQDEQGNIDETRIGPQELAEDNAWFTFGIQNTIDRTPPHISRIVPDIDQGRVSGKAPVQIVFSETMWHATLGTVSIEEHPKNQGGIDDLWYRTRAFIQEDGRTQATVDHRTFGPNGQDLYYFTAVPSTVRDAQQNCLYPGRGPSTAQQGCAQAADGTYQNCVGVTEQAETDTGCVTTHHPDILLQGTIDACKDLLRDPNVGPVNPPAAPGEDEEEEGEAPAEPGDDVEEDAPAADGAGEIPLVDGRPDTDADGIADHKDNCPVLANPNQADADNDGVGDLCEEEDAPPAVPDVPLVDGRPDTDGDGIADHKDNCAQIPNDNQQDTDGDGIGDVCDFDEGDIEPEEPVVPLVDGRPDTDADGIADHKDNCPDVPNEAQADADGNGIGDACEPAPVPLVDGRPDTDGDGVADHKDNCAQIANSDQADQDNDGLGNACDPDFI